MKKFSLVFVCLVVAKVYAGVNEETEVMVVTAPPEDSGYSPGPVFIPNPTHGGGGGGGVLSKSPAATAELGLQTKPKNRKEADDINDRNKAIAQTRSNDWKQVLKEALIGSIEAFIRSFQVHNGSFEQTTINADGTTTTTKCRETSINGDLQMCNKIEVKRIQIEAGETMLLVVITRVDGCFTDIPNTYYRKPKDVLNFVVDNADKLRELLSGV
jgi:hypothetical protein